MKLISWNCQGAFRNKAEVILAHKPDILVVQECEHPDRLIFTTSVPKPKFLYWHGDNIHKGIAVYSYSDYSFELLPDFNPEFRYVLPFRVTGNGESFILFAIWAMDNKENREARYIGQVWLAINHYANLLNSPSVLIGDFNSNQIWDYKGRVGNHSDVVKKLSNHNIHSIYHQHFQQEHGKETIPTFHLQRKREKPYHIDYCFASSDMLDKFKSLDIGSCDDWIGHSDHCPLILEFE